MTKIIGLTGGIGSGKTTVANYLQSLGIPVYIADAASKELADAPEILALIKRDFGEEVIAAGQLNRQKMAAIVFNNPEKLKQLNAIIHPAVRADFESWLAKNAEAEIVIKEAAILFESGSYKECDSVITVTAPIEIRIQRVMQRDHINREKVLERMKNQWTDEQRFAKSEYVVENTDFQHAKEQIDEILKKLLNQ